MSRVYITASMKHSSLGISLPTLSVETADHTGGGFTVGGLHPSTLAAMTGKGPEVKKGERFDLKANLNTQRTSLSLVVNTTKHLPHLEWSSENGMGKLPLGISTVATALLGVGGQKLLSGSGNLSKKRPDEKRRSRESRSSEKRRDDRSREDRSRDDRSRTSEKSRTSDRRRSYDDRSSRPSNKNQRAIMPREDYRSREDDDSGYQSDDRYERSRKHSSHTRSHARSRR